VPRSRAAAQLAAKAAPVPELKDLLRKRARKFLAVLPKALSDEDSDAVHDLRVWSRRLQQVLVTMYPKPRPQQANDVVRALRRARRALGEWRDCDVLIALLERRMHRVRNPQEHRAWEEACEAVKERRARAMRQGRRKLAHRRLFAVGQNIARLKPSAAPGAGGADGAPADPAPALSAAIRAAQRQWRLSLAHALETTELADIHAFRIQSKRLRYRVELARDLGADGAGLVLKLLKSLQDDLGRLHDRSECARVAVEALAERGFLLREPRAASLMLRRLARERELERAQGLATMHEAEQKAAEVERWVEEYGAAAGPEKIAPEPAA
jgi:CHAD domain-containing protein